MVGNMEQVSFPAAGVRFCAVQLSVCQILALKLWQKLVDGFVDFFFFLMDRLGLGSWEVLDREECFWNSAVHSKDC